MEAERYDLLLTGPEVITGESATPTLDNAVIGIRGSTIALLERRDPARPLPPAARTVDLSGHLVVPGFINVHTHTILTMVRGVAEDMGFAPAYTPGVPHGHEVTEEEAVALARLGALEALLFGSTLINDSYVHADLTLPAMAEVGLRVYTCGRIHDVDFSRVHLGEWEHKEAIGETTLGAAIALLEKWEGRMDGRVGVQLTPHAPDTCSRNLLRHIADYTEKRKLTVGTHLSQSEMENRRIHEREGRTPCELLDDVGLLNGRLLAAHGMFMSESDIRRAGAARMNLAHVPKGNATGGRIAPTRKMREAGVNLCLGTDNMHADMIEVMRWALCMGRIQTARIDDSWQPEDMLQMATANGAAAMGLQDELGTLAVGKKADLASIDMRRPHLVPRIDALGNLVHTGLGRDVSMVIVNGDVVVEHGRALNVDQDRIMADAQAAAEALWVRAREQVNGAGKQA